MIISVKVFKSLYDKTIRKTAMQFKKILNLLAQINANLISILCHHNADPDAIFSAYAMSTLLKVIMPQLKIEVAAAQGASKLSTHLINQIPLELVDMPSLEKADAILLVDTNTIHQLEEWKTLIEESNKPIIVIDHHATHPDTENLASIYIADEEASSTCEIIYDFFKESKMPISENVALALFLGIAYDTKHFALATSRTFRVVADLVKTGVNAKGALSLLSMPMDLSERIARLRAVQRTKIKKLDGYLLALSHLSTYQASAARALIYIGADVAVVAGEKNGSLRISIRANENFFKQTKIHLGRDIAKPLGEYLDGMGGGHPTAAGVNGKGDIESVFTKCVNLIKERI